MNVFEYIHNNFKPIQPITMATNNDVSFKQIKPHPSLTNYIYYYWSFHSNIELINGFNYKVVPNGCIDIFFELNTPGKNYITGQSLSNSEIKLTQKFHYVGICFMPLGFSMAYKINAADLTSRYENLDNVLPKTSKYITDSFSEKDTEASIQEKLDNFFIKLFSGTRCKIDNRLLESYAYIIEKAGNIKIETELNFGLSSRQLRRLFNDQIGVSPKAFANIIRFQKIIQSYYYYSKKRKIITDSGIFYDQSHFINEFKKFHGITPGKYEKRII